ncbi:phage tail tape measure protein [Laribacter hongkongensis]|uniref:phage tail tape measure protein n=1 Tax=Laribacter hongkongensis TaxID=168471 RepID=UPI001EFE4F2F|nr:phage tail tape measure protein [Laribacter hongkongensis]MCG9031410.1 phage tail tape measure protein [Laribacter hongkongensis]MCG9091630.1 phage tail tape measure protein [Laribacter hongkongensis]
MALSKNLRLEVILAATDKLTGPLKKAMAGSKGLAAAVRASQTGLKELQGQQQRLTAFRDLSRETKDTAIRLKAARQNLAGLQQQMASAGTVTGSMTRKLATAQVAVDKLSSARSKQLATLRHNRRELEAQGLTVSKLASHEQRLGRQIDTTSQALARQSEQLKRVSDRQKALHAAKSSYNKTQAARDKMAGAGAASAAGAAAVGGALAVPVLNYANAEMAATDLKAAMMIKGGTVAPEFDQINRLAERLGDRLPGTTAELQGMMTMLIRQGMSAQSILGGLGEATAYLGVQMKMPYEQAAEFTAKLQDATRTSEADMMGLVDTIQRAYYLGVDSTNMLEAYKGLGQAMDMIKLKGLDGAKALAPFMVMMDQAGMRGESAGNAISKVIAAGMDVGNIDKVQKKLKKDKGISLSLDFTNGKGEFGGIEKMMAELQKLKKYTTAERIAILKDLFGQDKETNMVLSKIIDQGQQGYDEVIVKMETQASLQERVNAQLGTLKNLWDAASGTFTNALVRFGEAISPELKDVTLWIGEMSSRLSTWASANPVLAATIMKTIAVIGLLLAAFAGLSLGIAAILGPMAIAKLTLATIGIKGAAIATPLWMLARSVLPALAGAIRFVMLAIMANPVGAAITLLVGLMTWAAVAIWQNWDTLGPKFRQLWESIRTGISGFFSWLGSLPARFAAAGADMMTGLVSGITSRLGWIRDSIMGVGDSVIGWFKQKLDIHSPSRVFAELGGFTMAGLAQGLDKGQAGPLGAVQSLAGKLTAIGAGVMIGGGLAQADAIRIDNRPPVAMAAPAASGGTVVQQVFHIHAAPGMDERALAAMVRREVEAAARAQAVRGRSSLKDRE